MCLLHTACGGHGMHAAACCRLHLQGSSGHCHACSLALWASPPLPTRLRFAHFNPTSCCNPGNLNHSQDQPFACLVKQSAGATALAALPAAPPSGPTRRPAALSMSQGRQTAVRRYEPHLQPSQVRVVSQTAEGNHETELAGFNSQHRKASQTHHGFA